MKLHFKSSRVRNALEELKNELIISCRYNVRGPNKYKKASPVQLQWHGELDGRSKMPDGPPETFYGVCSLGRSGAVEVELRLWPDTT